MNIKPIIRNLVSFVAGAIVYFLLEKARLYGVPRVPIFIILFILGIYIGMKSKSTEFIAFIGGFLVSYIMI